jgi:hypothetical protein
VLSGRVKLMMDVVDESNISSAAPEYSLDNGTTRSPAIIHCKGVVGCLPISGGNRTVVNKTYTPPRPSKMGM